METSLFDEKTEDELWKEFKKTKSSVIRDKIIRQYMPLVKYVAGKVSTGMPESVEFDDLVGFGQFGLLDAINKYDPDKNVKFKTYAVTRIRGAIFDELRELDWVPRSVRQKSREIEDTIVELEARFGRPATDGEVAKAMGMTEKEYLDTVMKVSGTSMLSLNDVWYSGDDSDNMSLADTIESPTSLRPDVIVEREEIRRIIIEAINELPENEKMVIVLYYHEDLTFKEIGQVLNV
ncbi:MAG: RNA polymerase sigma factor WhiG, partial [Treponema sp.]|nr:RNA polymerase sigma factor WhiG [Treponema sp.]